MANSRLIDGSEFLHIPKTGGSWVYKILKDNRLIKQKRLGGHVHATYDMVVLEAFQQQRFKGLKKAGRSLHKRVRRLTGAGTEVRPDQSFTRDQPFRFCFVRHPLSWYESWWKYMNGLGWHHWGEPDNAGGWHPNAALNGLGSNDFNQFVANVLRERPGYVSELYFSYVKPGISYVGKTETLASDLLDVIDHLALPVDRDAITGLGPVNVSTRPAEAISWDPEIRRTAMLLELPALLHFDYLAVEDVHALALTDTIKKRVEGQETDSHRLGKPDP